MQFVRGECGEIHHGVHHIKGLAAQRLRGVCMKEHAALAANFTHFAHGKSDPRLIVQRHQRHQGNFVRVLLYQQAQVIKMNAAVGRMFNPHDLTHSHAF